MRRWAALVIIWGLGAVSGSMVGWTSALFTSTTTNPGNAFEAAASFCPASSTQTAATDRDSYIREDQTGNNFGTANDLRVHSEGTKDRRTLVYFPLPSKPAGCVVSSAILRLYATTVSTGRTIEAYRLAATPSWTETGVTWSSQPPTTGSAATSASGSTTGWKEWNVTSQVDLMYSGTNNGFLLRDQSESAGSLQDQVYQSEEDTPNTQDPQLVISYSDEVCSSPGSQTILTTKDSWIDESAPTANHGTDSNLFVQSKATAQNLRSLVWFSLPSTPSGCSVTLATLRLDAASASGGRIIQAFRSAASWTETGVTWNNRPATAGTAAELTMPGGAGWKEWTVTSQVQDLYVGPNEGFILRDKTENSGGTSTQNFSSREGSGTPELVIRFG